MIAILFIFLFKTTKLSNLASKVFKADNNKVVDGDNDKTNKIIVNLSKNNKPRKSTPVLNIGALKKSLFLTFNAKKVFN